MKRKAVIWGLTVLIVSDGALLLRVSAERARAPLQTLQLTERELPMALRGPEDSSMSLRLAWRSPFFRARNSRPAAEKDATFNEEKLLSLGFRCGTPDSKSPYFRYPQHRPAYVVLARREDSAETAPKGNPVVFTSGSSIPRGDGGPAANSDPSSLVVVAAFANLKELRAVYPESQQHMAVRGVVGAFQDHDGSSASEPHWIGRVTELLPYEIYVPLPFAGELNRLTGRRGVPPRYTVTLHYGASMEPWVGSIRER
jgi:hypothetical protein